MIKRSGGGFKAFSRAGRPLSRKVKTKAGAAKQLRAVERAKHLRGR